MKPSVFLSLAIALGICSCSPYSIENPPGSHMHGVGKKDAAGLASGNWQLYGSKPNQVVGRGRFVAGKAEGLWVIYDSNGTKIAEIPYHRGVPHGDYRLYFTSFSYQGAAGKIKTIGSLENGVLTGRSRRYEPYGLVLDYRIENRRVVSAATGTRNQAEQMMEADRQYISLITREIHIGGQ